MKFKAFIILTIFMSPILGMSQQSITLADCHQAIDSGFPLTENKIYWEQINDLKQKNLTTNYLPVLELNGKFNYQSKVTAIPIAMPGISVPTPPKQSYGITLDVSQVIYDGGATKAARKVAQESTLAEIRKSEVDIYQVKEQVNQLFLNILLFQENVNILKLMHQTISERRKTVESAVANGIVNASELDNLDAELLNLESQTIELESYKSQTIEGLNRLCNLSLTSLTCFKEPTIAVLADSTAYRPEHQLFEQQINLLDANIDLTSTKRMPKVFAFVSAGGGNPGLNMYSDKFDTYYLAGAKLTWEIWDWKQTRRDKDQLTIQKKLIQSSRDAYNIQLNTKLSEEKLRRKRTLELIDKERELIALRQKIADRSANQMAQGIKTSADYLTDLNAEQKARIELKYKELELIRSEIDFQFTAGKSSFTEK